MKRIFTAIFSVLCLILPAEAGRSRIEIPDAGKGWTEVPDAAAVVAAFNAAVAKISSVDCSFTEEKYVDVLEAKSVSAGHFSFSAPGRILIEYLTPENSSISIDGDSMTLVSGGKTSSLDLASNRQYRRIFSLFSGADAGNTRMPEVKAYEKEGRYMLVFAMKAGGVSGIVEAVVDRADMSLESFRLKNGEDYTEYRFTDKKIVWLPK